MSRISPVKRSTPDYKTKFNTSWCDNRVRGKRKSSQAASGARRQQPIVRQIMYRSPRGPHDPPPRVGQPSTGTTAGSGSGILSAVRHSASACWAVSTQGLLSGASCRVGRLERRGHLVALRYRAVAIRLRLGCGCGGESEQQPLIRWLALPTRTHAHTRTPLDYRLCANRSGTNISDSATGTKRFENPS
ncbi:hypothetical protein J6590_045917 [Homalodisca vitripennis]|nr:hypothetical protein J6590_045917 [Homalodisca vitripennis]